MEGMHISDLYDARVHALNLARREDRQRWPEKAFTYVARETSQASGFRTFWNAKTYHSSGTFFFDFVQKKMKK